jgi:hypothetical protein
MATVAPLRSASAAERVIVTPAVTEGELTPASAERLESSLRAAIRNSELELVDVDADAGQRVSACAEQDDGCRAEALAAHGLADRLVAIVETRDPQMPLCLSQVATDADRRRITGLDRSVVLPLLASSSPAADAAWKSLAEQIVGGGNARP